MSALEDQAKLMLTATRMTKWERCKDEHGPTDLMPVVHIVDTEERVFVALVPDRDYIDEAVGAVVPEGSRIAYIGFCADAYGRAYPPGTDPESVQRGELLARFGLGDMAVTEELIITVIDVKSGDVFAVMQRYHYDDLGLPTFDEPVSFGGDQTGQVVDNLRDVARRKR